ncbi:GTPase-activating Rap/Ran-GAP domain-like protein 3, partial [Conglomerata obtusa]
MVQKNYMACAVKKENGQEDVDRQVRVIISKEMRKIEEERVRMLAFGKYQIKDFRKGLASVELSAYIKEKRWCHKNRSKIVQIEEREAEKIRINALRDRVMRYRLEILKERSVRNVESKEIGKHFFKSTRIRCYVCQDVGHRTSVCNIKFNLVLSRTKAEEENKKKKVDEKNITIIETNILDCKKGVVVPHALKSKLSEHLPNLEKKGAKRKSSIVRRNPIRALQPPRGEIRLEINFMAFNDLCEKDPYKLKNINEDINETHGYNYFTVYDLKEPFHSMEIEENHKYITAFEVI